MDLPVPKSKKKKTLQIMYPAPYSQSWEPDVLPVLMKKNMLGPPPRGPKCSKTKRGALGSPRTWSQQFPDRPDPTLPHLKYGVFRNRRGPTPYSQSWEPGVLPILMKRNLLGPSRGPKTKRAVGSPRTWSQQFPDRADPTIPRRKNGVFRNRRPPGPRSTLAKPERQLRMERFSKVILPKSMSAKQSHFKRSAEPIIRVPRQFPGSSSSSAPTVKQVKKGGAVSAGDRGRRNGTTARSAFGGASRKETSRDRHYRYHPVIVTRTINESYCRKLCLSNLTHVDIKPKTIGTLNSPSFCPSPSYRVIPRKVTM